MKSSERRATYNLWLINTSLATYWSNPTDSFEWKFLLEKSAARDQIIGDGKERREQSKSIKTAGAIISTCQPWHVYGLIYSAQSERRKKTTNQNIEGVEMCPLQIKTNQKSNNRKSSETKLENDSSCNGSTWKRNYERIENVAFSKQESEDRVCKTWERLEAPRWQTHDDSN